MKRDLNIYLYSNSLQDHEHNSLKPWAICREPIPVLLLPLLMLLFPIVPT